MDNDISAYGGKHREQYERMLEDIAAGLLHAVVVYNIDRLTRRPIELEQFTAVCEKAGVRQLIAVTGDIDLGNDDGMFMARVYSAVAAKESGRKSERLKRKARESADSKFVKVNEASPTPNTSRNSSTRSPPCSAGLIRR